MSEPVRLGMTKHGSFYLCDPAKEEAGTWYPDSDGQRAARDVAGELVEQLESLEWSGECRSCPCCSEYEMPKGHRYDCALAAVLAKARGEAEQ